MTQNHTDVHQREREREKKRKEKKRKGKEGKRNRGMGVAASCIRIRDDAEKDLLLAIGEGDINHVKLLLTSKPKLINSVTTSLPPLHHAASLGQPEVVT